MNSLLRLLGFFSLLVFIIGTSQAIGSSQANCEKVADLPNLNRETLEKILQPLFLQELAKVGDLKAWQENLNAYWQQEGLSSSWRLALARSSTILGAEQNIWQNFESAWSQEKTQALTEALLKLSLQHPDFAPRLQDVSSRLLEDISPNWQNALEQGLNEAIACLGSLLGSQFASALARSFQEELQQQNLLQPDLEVKTAQGELALLGVGSIALGQTARLLGQQLTQRLVAKIAERLVGRILTSAIPGIGWAVGGVMIGIDTVRSSQGALPMIREELGKPESITFLQQGLTESLSELLREENNRLAEKMSQRLAERWQIFQADYALTLTLSARYPALEAILLNTPQESWLWFTEIIAWLHQKNPARLEQSLKTGDLARLRQLPPESLPWLKQQDNFQEVKHWLALPAELLPVIFQQQWPQFFSARDFSSSEWQQLTTIPGFLRREWQGLPPRLIKIFLTWPASRLELWSLMLPIEKIAEIAYYSQKLSLSGQAQLLRQLDANPNYWQKLSWFQRLFLLWSAAETQADALDFYFANQGIAGFGQDSWALLSGQSPLFWYLSKYPAWLLLLLWLFLPFLGRKKSRQKSQKTAKTKKAKPS